MSNHMHFEYPPPRSWEQFEELCADLFQAMWNDPALVRHGRAGQRQSGVDIVARQGSNYPIGLQCKRHSRWPVKRLKTSEIDAEVKEALTFKPALKIFYFLTTADDDAKLQAHVRKINQKQNAAGLFEIVLLGWGELARRVTLYPEVASKHFGPIGGTPRSPLLATWFTSDGRLELQGDAFDLSCQELVLDLHDWPQGRVVVRQRESDVILQKVQRLGLQNSSIKQRKDRIQLRKQLRSTVEREQAAARGLTFILTNFDIAETILKVWEEEAATIISSFVERAISENSLAINNGDYELNIWPPNQKSPDKRFKIHYPASLYADVDALMNQRRAKWGRPLMDSVGELPTTLRAGYVVPAIIRKIMTRLGEGTSVDTLKAEGWLHLFQWPVEVC